MNLATAYHSSRQPTTETKGRDLRVTATTGSLSYLATVARVAVAGWLLAI